MTEPTDCGPDGPSARPAGEILHGGMSRLGLRQLETGADLPQVVSWYELAPGGRCRRHVHNGKTETWLIVQGTGQVEIGEATMQVGPGDLVITPPGTPHALDNSGDTPLRLVNIVARHGAGPMTTQELEEE